MNDSTTNTLQIDGYSVVIRQAGPTRGKPLLLIHGIGVAGNYFFPLANQLSREYRTIVVDLPGYGDAPRPPRPLTVMELSVVVADVMRALGLDDIVLIGQSMGCQVVAHVLQRSENAVAQAVLISPSTNKDERTVMKQAVRLLQDVFHERMRMNMLTLGDYMRMGPVRFVRTARYMVSDYIEETLRGVSVPILFVRGGNDKIIPLGWIRTLMTAVKDASLTQIEDAPHNLHYDHPIEVADAIRTFMERS